MTYDPKTVLEPGDKVLLGPRQLMKTSYWLTILAIDGGGNITVEDDYLGQETWTPELWARERVPFLIDYRRHGDPVLDDPEIPSVQSSDVDPTGGLFTVETTMTGDEPFSAPIETPEAQEAPHVAVQPAVESARDPASLKQKDVQGAGSLAKALEAYRTAMLAHQRYYDAYLAAQRALDVSSQDEANAREALDEVLTGMSEPFSGGVLPDRFQEGIATTSAMHEEAPRRVGGPLPKLYTNSELSRAVDLLNAQLEVYAQWLLEGEAALDRIPEEFDDSDFLHAVCEMQGRKLIGVGSDHRWKVLRENIAEMTRPVVVMSSRSDDEIPFGKPDTPPETVAEPVPPQPPAGAPATTVEQAERNETYEQAKPGFVGMLLSKVEGITGAKAASMAAAGIHTVGDWVAKKDEANEAGRNWYDGLRNFGPATVAHVEGAMGQLIEAWQKRWNL